MLSWWEVGDAREEVAIAIASTRDSVSPVDLAIVDTGDITTLGISWRKSNADTPYAPARDRHYDLFNLSAAAVFRLAEHLYGNRERIERLRMVEVRDLLSGAIERERLDLAEVSAPLLASLATRLSAPENPNPAALTAVLAELRRRVEAGALSREALDQRIRQRLAARETG